MKINEQRVRNRMKELGMSFRDIANSNGMDVKTVIYAVKGKRRLRPYVLGAISEVLGEDPATYVIQDPVPNKKGAIDTNAIALAMARKQYSMCDLSYASQKCKPVLTQAVKGRKCSPETLQAIADALDVDKNTLLI